MADKYTNGIVTKPIVLTKVANTVGYNTNDTGHLCGDDKNNVNKWSKYKPVRDTTLFPEYTERFFGQMNKAGIIYGMQVSQCTDGTKDAYELYEDENGNWEYLKPQGGKVGTGTPFRLGDFNFKDVKGYFHRAQPICASQIVKNKDIEISVGVTSGKTDMLRFFVEGIKDSLGSIGFSDIVDMENTDAKLMLCANVYDRWYTKSTRMEIICNNIKLNTNGQPTQLPEKSADGFQYSDGDRSKFAELQLEENYYKNSLHDDKTNEFEVNVLLTLDFVKYIDGQWKSIRKMVIPYDDEHYYCQKIIIVKKTNSLQVQAESIQSDYDAASIGKPTEERIIWQPIQYAQIYGLSYSYISSPRIRFTVVHLEDKSLTFAGKNDNGFRLVAKNGNNTIVGTLIRNNGNEVLDSVQIPAGTGEYVTSYIYYDFLNLFPEGENYYRQQGGWCYAELWLRYPEGSGNEDYKLGTISLKLK